ncbi:MAG: glycosyltransferase family 4 protein [Deltaproteobacteria bacterium]|nr:glycosyltransferase family 4 protein [Deltaproteobacteria bacterium]
MKVALVVQRFGENIAGVTESHCLQLAEQLRDNLHWTVHIFTTTALSYRTWANFYDEGLDNVRGLSVFRFNTVFPRSQKLFGLFNRLFAPLLESWGKEDIEVPFLLRPLSALIEKLWFILQGPYCPKLIKTLRNKKNEYDHFFFFTYLYYPSVVGFSRVRDKASLIPLAHDEKPLYFRSCQKLLRRAQVCLANSPVEKDLILSVTRDLNKTVYIAGCGLGPDYLQASRKRARIPLQGLKKPYIVYTGRVSKAKGIFLLVEYFLQYILHHGRKNLSLVLAGESDGTIKFFYHPQIKFVGYISDGDRPDLLINSSCVVNPSPMESLSLLVLEALALKKPILVNSRCAVLKYYSDTLETVFPFNSYKEFDDNLTKIFTLRKLVEFKPMLKNSQDWVKKAYSWDKIVRTYESVVAENLSQRKTLALVDP